MIAEKHYCACGCGGEPGKGNKYIHGHNSKGRIPTEETKKKSSVSNMKENRKIRFPHLCECGCGEIIWGDKIFINGHNSKGENNGMFGKIHSIFSKDKMSSSKKGISPKPRKILKKKATCLICGIELSNRKTQYCIKHWGMQNTGKDNPSWKGGVSINYCIFCGKKIQSANIFCEKHYNRNGSNNPNWKGGTSFLPYCLKFNKELKEKIRIRDNRICQLCGKSEEANGQKLSIHHIHYDKENCYPDLISLCRSCNCKVNGDRIYYINLFMNKLNDKNLLCWGRDIDAN